MNPRSAGQIGGFRFFCVISEIKGMNPKKKNLCRVRGCRCRFVRCALCMPKWCLIMIGLWIGFAGPVRGGATPAIVFQQKVYAGGWGGIDDQVQGWDFQLTTNVTVVKLGLYYGFGNPI